MTANNEQMLLDLAIWEDELERAGIDLQQAKEFDDRGAIDWHEERVRWARIKITEIEDYLESQKGA